MGIESYLRKEDFKSVRHDFLVINHTSGTQITDPGKMGLVEIKERGLVLKMPPDSCRVGHSLGLYLFPYPLRDKIVGFPFSLKKIPGMVQVIGKVVEINGITENKFVAVEIEFTQYEEKEWVEIVSRYENAFKRIKSIQESARE